MEKLTLTRAQMLEQWSLRRHLEPLRADAQVQRQDGVDTAELMGSEMDRWYAELIDTAPAELLAPQDIAGPASLAPGPEPGSWCVNLPQGVRRVTRVRLSSWRADAVVVTDPRSPLAVRQLSPLTQAGERRPVAVMEGLKLTLHSTTDSKPRLAALEVVMEPDGITYSLDSLALAGINEE